jgi:hypothetical protein
LISFALRSSLFKKPKVLSSQNPAPALAGEGFDLIKTLRVFFLQPSPSKKQRFF